MAFVVDTGFTDPLMIFDWAATKLNLKPQPVQRQKQLEKHDYDEGPPVRMALTSSAPESVIRINGDIPTILMHGTELDILRPGKLAGVIGLPFFVKSTVEIDFKRKLLSFVSVAHAPLNPEGRSVVPLVEREPNRLYVPVKYADGREELLLLDTGSPTTGIPEQHATHVPTSGAVLRGQSDFEGTIHLSTTILADRLTIGSATIDKVPLFITTGKEWLLGTDVLRRFHVIVDCRNKQLLLRPGGGMAGSHDTDGFTGIHMEEDATGFFVGLVTPQGPGDKAGIKPGMRLLRVDGEELSDLPVWSVNALVYGVANRPLRLRIKEIGGKEREIVVTPENDFNRMRPQFAGLRLLWKEGEGISVEGVQPDSSAYGRGLRQGDVIDELNGISTKATPPRQLFTEFSKPKVRMLVRHSDSRVEVVTMESEKKK